MVRCADILSIKDTKKIQKKEWHLQTENLEENDSYLRIISDVPTRWNSSYLAWIRLLKIQNLIDIMASSLSVNSNLQARKDGKRLKEINLVDEEWKPLRKLTNILKKFAEATENTKESDKVADYLAIPQIQFNDCPLEWWK
ncbi:hypothetical protein RhiirA1_402698 [Rhizophagus irregularis]|uniref:Uncharacterized protein n=1 Tax=Rhizophagus irregularis TaxID=588596 RepID=A0A2I1FHV8_9GLOM|nr:hypothetical protein RhiirA1_402698 [Rhizophagus irregularis]PKY33965.1 hypothetical protein RhiirB3_395210 [Rhizophagus irregularis]